MDRPSLCEALGKEIARQERRPLLFVEINTGAEPQKAGVLPQDADAFLARCREAYGLTVAGLMCIPPADEAPAPHFALTAKIAARNGLKLLSMGMSADFATAIAMGATHVRVGSAIFGARDLRSSALRMIMRKACQLADSLRATASAAGRAGGGASVPALSGFRRMLGRCGSAFAIDCA